MNGWDLLDGQRGLLASVRTSGVTAFRDGRQIDDVLIDAEPVPTGPSLELSGLGGTATLTSATAAGTLRSGAGDLPFNAPALLWTVGGQGERPALARTIAVSLADGRLLLLRATRDAGARGHGDEQRIAAIMHPDGTRVDVGEALLSTEFGADGMQRRATLELWTADDSDLPVRGAGVLICSVARQIDGARRRLAFFRWSVDGVPGLGRYELAEPD